MFQDTNNSKNRIVPPENAYSAQNKKSFARHSQFRHDRELSERIHKHHAALVNQVMDLQIMVEDLQDELENLEVRTCRRTGMKKKKFPKSFPNGTVLE